MISAIRMGLKEVINNLRLASIMAFVVAISLASFLILQGYHTGLQADFPRISWPYLVVIQTGSLGELYGSRMPTTVGDELIARGEPLVVPEIHTVVGTTAENAVFLRGIPLDSYSQVEDFSIVAGKPMQVGDPARQAMVGIKLAEARKVNPGDMITLRGRDFTVACIFQVGSYADDEAWISLKDAQTLLGWGNDVSFYIISDRGVLHEGDHLPGGVAVTRRGESGWQLANAWQPMFDLMAIVANTLALAATVALANELWRLAWVRRHDLAILRSVGFSRMPLAAYLAVQGVAVTVAGFGVGWGSAILVSKVIMTKTAGFSLTPVYNLNVLLGSAGLAGLIALVGTLLPAWWLSRINLATLLRVE